MKDSYKISWKRSTEKDIRNIDRKQIPRIIHKIESLADNPFPTGYRKIRGSEHEYRIRVGDYRVVY